MLKHKQPRGFAIFFLTEMWERYGFYVLQTLLVFYALDRIHLDDADTYSLVGSFTALAYVNSIFGGILADRYLGYNKSVLSGAALLSCGYALLAINGSITIFILGLAIVTVGTGMLKPNISSMLSILYQQQAKIKEIGYTIFYIGIYFGAIGGSFLGGYLREYLGWPAVFFSAMLGLMIAFFTFWWGYRHFNLYDQRLLTTVANSNSKAAAAIVALIAIAYGGLHYSTLSNSLFTLIAILSIIFLGLMIRRYQGATRRKLIAFSILIVFSVAYWAVYFQQFFTISLCIARVANISLPESSLTAFESLGVIIFGPLINALWAWQSRRNQEYSIPTKFSLSFLFNSLSFLVLALSLQYALNHHQLQNQTYIICSYFLIAIGELFLAPIGLAMVSTLVPIELNGAMMGLFLMSIGLGGKLAGLLAQSAVATSPNVTDLIETYRDSFMLYCGFSFLVFILCLIMVKPINKLIHGDN